MLFKAGTRPAQIKGVGKWTCSFDDNGLLSHCKAWSGAEEYQSEISKVSEQVEQYGNEVYEKKSIKELTHINRKTEKFHLMLHKMWKIRAFDTVAKFMSKGSELGEQRCHVQSTAESLRNWEGAGEGHGVQRPEHLVFRCSRTEAE